MAEVIGAGVLGLPYATARLGLACGVMAALLFGAAALYSGLLLVRTKHDLGQHEANSYNDLGHALGGKTFGRMTGGVVLVTWAMMLPYFLLACADSITLVFPEWQLKTWQSALITFAILVLPLQLRTLHHISMLCLPSALAVVVAISIILASLFNAEHAETSAMGPDFNPWPDKQFTFFDFFGDIGAFVFAYSGHSMYLEMMREMVDSREFGTTALPVATLVMVICYTGTAVAGVCAYGSAVSDFLPNSMPEGPAKRCVGVLLAFHTLVSYWSPGSPSIAPSTPSSSPKPSTSEPCAPPSTGCSSRRSSSSSRSSSHSPSPSSPSSRACSARSRARPSSSASPPSSSSAPRATATCRWAGPTTCCAASSSLCSRRSS